MLLPAGQDLVYAERRMAGVVSNLQPPWRDEFQLGIANSRLVGRSTPHTTTAKATIGQP